MSYLDRVLQPDEQVIAIGRMHWMVYLRGLVAIALAVFLWSLPGIDAINKTGTIIGGALVALYGVLYMLVVWIETVTTEIAVTNRRVIHKRGLIRRQTDEMNLQKVESVAVEQSILGRIFNFGSVVVRGTGAGMEGLHHIADPLSLRSAIVAR